MNKPLSESEYLAKQADDAKEALSNAAHDLGTRVGETVNIAGWTREFPWATIAVATVAGFVSASAIVPSKRQQARKRLREIEEALTSSRRSAAAEVEDGKDGKAEPTGSHFVKGMMSELIKSLPRTLSVLVANLATSSGPPPSGRVSPDTSSSHPPDL